MHAFSKPVSTIFVDLDGVLADFHTAVAKLWGLDPATLNNDDWARLGEWGLGIPMDDFWPRIQAAGPEFWSGLEKMPWADELWDACQGACDTVVVLTAPGPFPESAAGKYAWVRAQLNTTKMLIGSPKEVCSKAGHVLIDDRAGYRERWEAEGGTLLSLGRPWNPTGLDPREIIDILRSL
ncbi:MAG: hypothetical protein HN348_17725 [Proteobacteria bacterium]|jgi:hypothetical protein|nr:hypothetical protein [Pseudomonadota bacterium]